MMVAIGATLGWIATRSRIITEMRWVRAAIPSGLRVIVILDPCAARSRD